MKKKLLLGFVGFIFLLGAEAVVARTIALCSLPYKQLMRHGFMQGALYTGQQVKSFFDVVNVEPENLALLHPDLRYAVNYHCYRDKGGVAHASLEAIETPTPVGMVTPNTVTVHWEFTK